jgi:hypothetical protein
VRSLGTTIEGLALVVGEAVTVPVLEVVVEEQVPTGVHQNQLLLVGELVCPSPSSHDVSLTCQKRALQLL